MLSKKIEGGALIDTAVNLHKSVNVEWLVVRNKSSHFGGRGYGFEGPCKSFKMIKVQYA